jgi:glucose/arabinose dehydrogenase
MQKFFIGLGILALIIVSLPLFLIASGTIDSTSLRMMLNVMAGLPGPSVDINTVKTRYQVPDGFSLSLYENDLSRARFMTFTEAGDLLVSRPHVGDIVLLRRDTNGDGKPDGREIVMEGLQRPLGIDVHGSWLYVGESHQVGRVLFDSATGKIDGPYQPIIEGLTDNGNHWSKTVRIGPDGMLYLAQGSTCNICEEPDERRATMMRFAPDGSGGEIIATGLRNSVGFDWAPWNDALFATDNGRDLLGDDFPPCELNRIEDGRFYGWPYFNGNNIPDPGMGLDPQAQAREPTVPAHRFRAHNAPLGMTFLRGDTLPQAYAKTALVALHGSWNRSEPDGYKVVSLTWTDDGIEERDFLSGFNFDDDITGRPVDVAQAPDGSIYVSDDYAGAIYRLTYTGDQGAGTVDIASTVQSRLDKELPQWLLSADVDTMAVQGASLYKQHACASCHEEGGNPAQLNGLSKRMGFNAVDELLLAPPSPMPIFPLSQMERRELAVYLLDRP